MVSFKALAAAVLLSATAATPIFAQAPGGVSGSSPYIKNLHDSGYNPKNDFNPNGTIRAAIQEPGLFAFYYPNLDVLNGGAPTPAARMSPDWPALKGACASAGGGISYCGDRYRSYDFAANAFPRHHGRRHHRS
jgi:BA14K-like protein